MVIGKKMVKFLDTNRRFEKVNDRRYKNRILHLATMQYKGRIFKVHRDNLTQKIYMEDYTLGYPQQILDDDLWQELSHAVTLKKLLVIEQGMDIKDTPTVANAL